MLFTFVYAMVRKSDVCLEILSKDLIKIPVDNFLIIPEAQCSLKSSILNIFILGVEFRTDVIQCIYN